VELTSVQLQKLGDRSTQAAFEAADSTDRLTVVVTLDEASPVRDMDGSSVEVGSMIGPNTASKSRAQLRECFISAREQSIGPLYRYVVDKLEQASLEVVGGKNIGLSGLLVVEGPASRLLETLSEPGIERIRVDQTMTQPGLSFDEIR